LGHGVWLGGSSGDSPHAALGTELWVQGGLGSPTAPSSSYAPGREGPTKGAGQLWGG